MYWDKTTYLPTHPPSSMWQSPWEAKYQVKKITGFYVTQKFITVFTKDHH
jgi:hypothetical protein